MFEAEYKLSRNLNSRLKIGRWSRCDNCEAFQRTEDGYAICTDVNEYLMGYFACEDWRYYNFV
jgi:hypothetical protein